MTHRYDAVIIGTGQAGPSLAGRLAGAGMKAAIVERHRFGGEVTIVEKGPASWAGRTRTPSGGLRRRDGVRRSEGVSR